MNEHKRENGDDRPVEDAPQPKRRRKSGWDAPAPPAKTNTVAPTATTSATVAPSPPNTSAVAAPPAAFMDAATAQLIALQKAQQILAQTGMQVGVQAPGAAAVAGGVNLGALVANMSKNYENRIYVGSLHYSITEVEIRAVFGSIGPIRMVDMSFDPLTQRSKGYCFIDFENAADAQAAMAMNGVEIAGRAMKVGRPQNANNNIAAMSAMGAMAYNPALVAATAAAIAAKASLPQPTMSTTHVIPQIATSSPVVVAPKTIVILDDMVPVHEASDPELKGEIEEEAVTYGPLKDISIEVVDNKFVRIKLFFADAASAQKAFNALNGRYFGGNLVKASLSS